MRRKTLPLVLAVPGVLAAAGMLYLRWLVSPSSLFDLRLLEKLGTTRWSVVVPGENGWLFYRPALKSLVSPWPGENADRVIELDRELAREDIRLLVVPVPNKSDIYPELLGLGALDGPGNQMKRFLGRLEAAHIRVVNLFPAFYARKAVDTLYFPCDTHWNQAGILLAADAVAREITTLAPTLPRSLALGATREAKRCCADLAELQSPGSTRFNGGSRCLDRPYPWEAVVRPDGRPMARDSTAPILFFGDSFTDAGSDVGAQLNAQVARMTGIATRYVYRLDASFNGPPMLASMIRGMGAKPRMVVWVFVSMQLMRPFAPPG